MSHRPTPRSAARLLAAIALPLALAAVARPAHAAAAAGDLRIGAAFAAVATQDLDLGAATDESFTADLGSGGRLRLGWLATDRVEMGLGLSFSRRDVELDIGPGFATIADDVTTFAVLPYGELRFALDETGDLVVAPGLALGYARTDADLIDAHTFELVASATLEVFLTPSASIDLGLQGGWTLGDGTLRFEIQDSLLGRANAAADLDIDGWSVGGFVGLSIWP